MADTQTNPNQQETQNQQENPEDYKYIEQEYRRLLEEGDVYYDIKDYEDAKKNYEAALVLKSGDKIVMDKLFDTEMCMAILEDLKKKEDIKTQVDEERIREEEMEFKEMEFRNLVLQGDKDLEAKDYEDAKNKYEEALKLKPENKDVKKKLFDTSMFLSIMNDLKHGKEEREKGKESVLKKGFGGQIEAYNNRFKELKEMISQFRKEGRDTFMADLQLTNFKSKMLLAEATRKQEDMDFARQLLEDAEKELTEIQSEELINIKEEVEEGAKKLFKEEMEKEAMNS